MTSCSLVSIVVPAYNSASTLGVYLDSVLNQTYPNIELIVVDDGSTDETPAIVMDYVKRAEEQKRGIRIHLVRNEKNLGRQKSRNYGQSRASGKYLWFMDSDMELTPEIVENCVAECEQGGYDALMIPERSKGRGFWARCRGLEKRINDDDLDKMAIRFMHRDILKKVGGHDSRFVADDYDFHIRATQDKVRYRLLEGHYIYHYELPSILEMMRKYFKYGMTMPSYISEHPRESMKQFFPMRRAYLENWRLFLWEPLTGIGLLGLKFLQYAAASLGMVWYGMCRFFRFLIRKRTDGDIPI